MKAMTLLLGAALLSVLLLTGCDPCGELESKCDRCTIESERLACQIVVDGNDKALCEAALVTYDSCD